MSDALFGNVTIKDAWSVALLGVEQKIESFRDIPTFTIVILCVCAVTMSLVSCGCCLIVAMEVDMMPRNLFSWRPRALSLADGASSVETDGCDNEEAPGDERDDVGCEVPVECKLGKTKSTPGREVRFA